MQSVFQQLSGFLNLIVAFLFYDFARVLYQKIKQSFVRCIARSTHVCFSLLEQVPSMYIEDNAATDHIGW